MLRDTDVDAVFLDIRMPGLDGMELARVLRPVRPAAGDRLRHRVRRPGGRGVRPGRGRLRPQAGPGRPDRRVAAPGARPPGWCRRTRRSPAAGARDDPTIPVELAGTTRMLPRSSVRWVEAQGDYARLHTADGSHLVRVSLATLAERWADAGFVRIHRSYLVQLRLITELRLTNGGYVVVVDGRELPVSRRHTRELKDRLVRAAKQDWTR